MSNSSNLDQSLINQYTNINSTENEKDVESQDPYMKR